MIPRRFVELAPQYFLGNLPSSDGKELLMELRQSLEPPGLYDQEGATQEHDRNPRDAEGGQEPHNQSSTELCAIQ